MMTGSQSFRLFRNPHHGVPGVVVLPQGGFRRAAADIRAWPGYAPVPLRAWPDEAARAGVATLHGVGLGAEAKAFGFSAAGGAYAAARALMAALARRGVAANSAAMWQGEYLAEAGEMTIACAGAAPHAEAVARTMKRLGARCVAFLPRDGVKREAIEASGAEIRFLSVPCRDLPREAAAEAGREGWPFIADTSWPGYTETPRDIMQACRVVAEEALAGLPEAPTHIFAQGGKGAVAAAISVQARARFGDAVRLVVVEAEGAAPLLASAEGKAVPEMEPNLLAWQELERGAFAFMAVPDSDTARGEEDIPAGLAALLGVARDEGARAALQLGAQSRVVLLGAEEEVADLYA